MKVAAAGSRPLVKHFLAALVVVVIVLVVMADYAEKQVYWLEGLLKEAVDDGATAAVTLITEMEFGALFDVVAHLTHVHRLADVTKSLHVKCFVMEIDGYLQTVVEAAAG